MSAAKNLFANLRQRFDFLAKERGVIVNTFWLVGDKVLRLAIGLFVGIWVARYLGPEQFGLLNYAISFVGLFGSLASLGLDGVVVRRLTVSNQDAMPILGSAFALKLIGGMTAFVFAVFGSWLLRPTDLQFHWFVGIISLGMLLQAFDVVDFWFQSQVQSRNVVLAKNTAFLSLAAAKIWLISIGAALSAFVWAVPAEILLGAMGLVFRYQFRCREKIGHWQFNWSKAIQLLAEAYPLFFSSVAVAIYMRIDQILLGQMIGERAVGIYAAAVRISEMWYFIPLPLASSFAPSIAQARTVNVAAYKQRLQLVCNLLAKMAIWIAIPVTFCADWIIALLYGPAYMGAGTILSIHIWAAIFVFLGVASNTWLINEGLTRFSFVATLLGSLLNIALNYWLIPQIGIVGSAIATIFSQMVASYLVFGLFAVTRPLFYIQTKSIRRALFPFGTP